MPTNCWTSPMRVRSAQGCRVWAKAGVVRQTTSGTDEADCRGSDPGLSHRTRRCMAAPNSNLLHNNIISEQGQQPYVSLKQTFSLASQQQDLAVSDSEKHALSGAAVVGVPCARAYHRSVQLFLTAIAMRTQNGSTDLMRDKSFSQEWKVLPSHVSLTRHMVGDRESSPSELGHVNCETLFIRSE